MNFEDLKLIKPLRSALSDVGYESPTPIQSEAIPHILEGSDLLATAQTGTGKTAAFALPMLQNCFNNNVNHKGIRGLVIAPTRELAQQIFENFFEYSKYINIKTTVIFGGVSQKRQERILARNNEIIIATPGRLIDLMDQGIIKLDMVETFVLDEADRLLDMGFIHDIKKIGKALPSDVQTLLFSATMPKSVVKISNELLKNPVSIATAIESTPADTVSQKLYYVDPDNKKKLLVDLIKRDYNDSVLVFVRTKNNAERLTRYLDKAGISAMSIHGDKSQNQRARALQGFKEYKFQVLVATDVAARGIDIDKLGCVFNYNIPDEAEVYVHRIGRTGRAGAVGESVSFCDHGEKGLLRDIEKLMNLDIEVEHEHEYPLKDTTVLPPDNRTRRSKSRGGQNKRGRGNRGRGGAGKSRSNSSNKGGSRSSSRGGGRSSSKGGNRSSNKGGQKKN